MHYEEWSASRVAAALAALRDAGFTEPRLARLSGVNRSQVNRWSRGENRPGHDPVRRLAVAIWREHPALARELVEASGYTWAEPSGEPEPESLVPSNVLAALEEAYAGDPEGLRQAVEAQEAIARSRLAAGLPAPGQRAG